MSPPTVLQTFRQLVGVALTETGQMLDRVGLRGLQAVSSSPLPAASLFSRPPDPNSTAEMTSRRLSDNANNHLKPNPVPLLFDVPFSRHRSVMPLFKSGTPSLSSGPSGTRHSFVAPSAHIIGDVSAGPDCSFWYGSVIRGDCAPRIGGNAPSPDGSPLPKRGGVIIGEGTNVQDNATVRCGTITGVPCVVGRGVTIGHNACLVGTTVGDHVLVGMGASLLEGSVVEGGSFVAAGAVVTKEGGTVKKGELWGGNPARKIKDLTDRQKAQLHFQAEEYVKLSKLHIGFMQLGGNFPEARTGLAPGERPLTAALQAGGEEQAGESTTAAREIESGDKKREA